MNVPATIVHTETDTDIVEHELSIELGDIVVLTEGQGRGSSEDKRRAYNC